MWVGKIVDEKGANYLDFNQNPYLDMVSFFFIFNLYLFSGVCVCLLRGFFV